MSYNEPHLCLKALDPLMECQIGELRLCYTTKHQPVLDTVDAKKSRQQNF